MPFALILRVIALLCCLGLQTSIADSDQVIRSDDGEHDAFTFVRIKYDSSGGFGESWYRHDGRDWQRWETDYPRAENNLILRLKELTSMQVRKDPIVLELTDDALMKHPFIFMSDVGWQVLSDAEQNIFAPQS